MVRMALIFMLCAISSFAYDLQYHPLLLQVKDKHGESLAKALDKIYGDKIAVQKNRCHYFEMTKGSDTEYEIDWCKINYTQQKVYSQADRLNGIEIKGCFDTGNSAICALKSNHFVDNGDEIEFEISGQIIKKKVVKRKNILHGGIKSDERPVVHFDITFNEKTLKNVEVCVRGLTDIEKKREKETNKKIGGKKILLSTYVIDKLGLIVHPDRNLKFIKS